MKPEKETAGRMSSGRALRHLVLFQLKLALDALRDLVFSPLSIGAFVLDALIRPQPGRSLSHRLMLLGRRSDRVINLFGEYGEGEHYTVDRTLEEVEQAVYARHQHGRSPRRAGNGDVSERGAGVN